MSIASLAQVPVVTDISFNAKKFNNAAHTMEEWSKVNNELQERDRVLLRDNVVEAYSQMRVEEYVGMSKTFSPFMKA